MKAYVFGQDSQDQAHENFKFPEELLPRGNSLHGQHTNWRDFIKIEQNSLFYARWVNYQIYIVFYTVNMSR